MHTAIDEIREELHVLRSAILPDVGGNKAAGAVLPPVKLPPHMT
jgi:hypothetical protein